MDTVTHGGWAGSLLSQAYQHLGDNERHLRAQQQRLLRSLAQIRMVVRDQSKAWSHHMF